MTVSPTMPAVMKTNRFCGMGSWTWSSLGAWEKKRELMLARQGKIIRGKLTTTEAAKPEYILIISLSLLVVIGNSYSITKTSEL